MAHKCDGNYATWGLDAHCQIAPYMPVVWLVVAALAVWGVWWYVWNRTAWGIKLQFEGAWHGHRAVHRGPWADCTEEPCRRYNGKLR